MSAEQKDSSGELTTAQNAESTASHHTEATERSAEIVYPDGTRQHVTLSEERYWSGALPRPRDFADYALVVPDAPERILRMAEKEQDHRIASETKLIQDNSKAGSRGQWLGAILSAVAMGLAVFAHLNGAPWQLTTALVGIPVMSVARSLVSSLKSSD